MINVENLIDLTNSYNPHSDKELLRRAFDYAKKMHKGQLRRSGEPYFTHPFAVAMQLAEQHMDDATLTTALLHDTIEDTKSTYSDIKINFSEEIAELVDGVTKLTNLELGSVESAQAENFRKLLLAMSKDLRVLLVKLADRLHNMRTIRHMDPEKQLIKARETMDIYAPLAGRMGMQFIREELEDLSFRVLNSEARSSIMRRFVSLRSKSGDVITKIADDIRKALNTNDIAGEVTGREKKPYSIWRKMEEKQEGFSRLSDIYGFRIITKNDVDCYRALGAIHQRWRSVPGRFKDYISQPKSNGYRSLHTAVSGRDGKIVEVQIRTNEMHQVAETGVAAHWSYREGERSENKFAVDPFVWISEITESFSNTEDQDEFLEHVKLEMFADQVFCFTPKGDVVKLPRGATPLDFAYNIHTRIGDGCVGVKVDGKRVPLWTRLRNGQSVEIITAKGQKPQAAWTDVAVTGRAKTAIRRSLKTENRENFLRLGKEFARVAFENVGKKPTNKALSTVAKMFALKTADDILVALGSAELTGAQVIEVLYPELLRKNSVDEIEPSKAIIGLMSDQSAQRSVCCEPLPGERIVGILTKGRGVMIHTIDCDNLAAYDQVQDRWIDLHWSEGNHQALNEVLINITIGNDAGVLGRICTLIGEQNANISDMRFEEKQPDFYKIAVSIEVRDVKHLHNVVTSLNADTDVAEVTRHRDLIVKT
ncbi:MAG: bifunctional (p)ppGpp synthetase/guanosine-3',5'-bis(diphosphate) 3'-pyrophosphohydrolase [Rhodobacteraceae bacterium]|nr:bifunctional (p)ppGpp synthetase/guanosine-3',5'-bis(diphosphate) 3'-pyrophosphohydrolase [Paracoccaceae bacterium]